MPKKTGICRLCHREAELQDSHIIPAAVFAQMRDVRFSNPNPWVHDRRGGAQTSKQFRAHILCQKCEGRFNKGGEHWILSKTFRGRGNFKLRDMVLAAPRLHDGAFCSTLTAPKIKTDQLAYFGISSIWRASIYNAMRPDRPPLELYEFKVPIEQYLLGNRSFPENMWLWAVVDKMSRPPMMMLYPYGGKVGNIISYKFGIPGLTYVLFAGDQTPNDTRQLCIQNSPYRPVLFSDMRDLLSQDLRKLIDAKV